MCPTFMIIDLVITKDLIEKKKLHFPTCFYYILGLPAASRRRGTAKNHHFVCYPPPATRRSVPDETLIYQVTKLLSY
jgi:hypothetical protein